MPSRIEDYGMIGNCQTGALVSKGGSIDWLCFPRFDSEACFAALLGTKDHGHWLLAPDTTIRNVNRHYLGDTLVLETEYTTFSGTVALIDFMPFGNNVSHVVRIVEGRSGSVPMRMNLSARFDTGQMKPWLREVENGVVTVVGGEALRLATGVEVTIQKADAVAEFSISAGERIPLVLSFFSSSAAEPKSIDAQAALKETIEWWQNWASQCTYEGPYRNAVVRSLITLKALTYQPTGGIIGALTASLPENLGGERNWDYRYCWLRDATLMMHALLVGGYTEEACAWRDWLLRAVGGDPAKIQPVYNVSGERRILEHNADWLPGFRGSRPVRLGNAASQQLQLDAYGEVMDVFHTAHQKGISPEEHAWDIQKALLAHLESAWQEPDHGIWEVRGGPHHFTHSKVMAWVAFDRGVKAVEELGLKGPAQKWKRMRKAIHQDVCQHGFSSKQNTFVQAYDNEHLDASLLMIPLTGFLPCDDERVQATVKAVQAQLTDQGLVRRYDPKHSADPDKSSEGTFLLCSFWLAACLSKMGRKEEANELYERLLNLRNDVGLLSEEYDPHHKRFLGNFPQAFSHVPIINTAFDLLPEDPGGDATAPA